MSEFHPMTCDKTNNCQYPECQCKKISKKQPTQLQQVRARIEETLHHSHFEDTWHESSRAAFLYVLAIIDDTGGK